MKIFYAMVFLLITTSVRAQDGVCHNDGSGRDAGICAKQAADIADANLNSAYKSELNKLNSSDNMARARTSLVESERAWIKFRDADCAVQDHIFEKGSMRGAMVEQCLKELAERRTKELQSIWLP